jgi:steroid delta-isomerase-like uncharacterized protein
MSEENKAIARRFMGVFESGDLSLVDELLSGDYIDHNPFSDQRPGPEGMRDLIGGMRTTVPDMKLTVDDIIADGDRVVTRWTGTGTHQGEFIGIPASGNALSVTGINIDRIEDGKIVERWEQFDAMGMMQQMGAIPS